MRNRDFCWVLRNLRRINQDHHMLQSVAANASEYGAEQARTAHDEAQNITEMLTTAFNLLSLSKLKGTALDILEVLAGHVSNKFPELNSKVISLQTDSNPSGVEYGVYMMLDTYVREYLKGEFPSVIALDMPYSAIPKDAAVIILPELGSTAIVFGNYGEASICFSKYVKPHGRLSLAENEDVLVHQTHSPIDKRAG